MNGIDEKRGYSIKVSHNVKSVLQCVGYIEHKAKTMALIHVFEKMRQKSVSVDFSEYEGSCLYDCDVVVKEDNELDVVKCLWYRYCQLVKDEKMVKMEGGGDILCVQKKTMGRQAQRLIDVVVLLFTDTSPLSYTEPQSKQQNKNFAIPFGIVKVVIGAWPSIFFGGQRLFTAIMEQFI